MIRSALVACTLMAFPGCASSRPSGDAQPVADVTVAPSAVASASVTASSSAAPPGDPLVAKCEAHDREACQKLALHCSVGQTVDPKWESKECAERERRACEEGAGESCADLADRYTDVTGDVGVAKDEQAAMKLYEKACETGGRFNAINACMRIAYAYEGGFSGLAKNAARAVELFEGLCDEEGGIFPQPCQALARHLAAGDGVAKNEARAARIHAATCGQGVCDVDAIDALCSDVSPKAKTTAGCVARARVYMLAVAGAPAHDFRKAKNLLERACKRSEAEGCLTLSEWYAEGKDFPGGPKVPQDPRRAASFRDQACKAGEKTACPQ
jgi:TPR repeat protein